MHFQPVSLARPDPEGLAELERLIRQGAGGRDVVEAPAQPERRDGPPSPGFLQYELNLEFKHLRLLVPQVERFVSLAGRRVLDFGCGTGGVSVAVCSRGAYVVGVEPIGDNLRAARVRARLHGLLERTAFLHLPDTARLPFLDASFDLCIANSVLEYVYDNRQAYLSEIWRVLKPGGVLYLGDTSNGLYPREMHSGRWLINYQPRKVRQLRCVSGVSYWEIKRLLAGRPHGVLNLGQPGQAREAFLGRRRPSPALRALLDTLLLAFQKTVCRPLGAPLEAFLPWLNLAIAKLPGPSQGDRP